MNNTKSRRKVKSSSGLSKKEYLDRLNKSKEKNDIERSARNKRRKSNSNSSKNRNEVVENRDYDELDEKDSKKSFKKKVLKIVFRIFLIILFILFIMFIISCFKWNSLAKDMIKNTSSIVVDSSGKKIGDIGSNRNRKNISIDEMPENLKNAYVAIEDQRFYKHMGIDIRRTGAATLSYIKNLGHASFGGSTITQQLVKNLTGNNSKKVSRKFDEWSKAFVLELTMSKEEILEAYLNIIYVGPNVYGVEMGSFYYFSKSAKDLTLEECAYLAGINISPYSFNPFRDDVDNSEKIKTRTKTVLNKMYELKFISKEELDAAKENVEKGLNFKKGELSKKEENINSYHTDALTLELINDLSDKKHISQDFAKNYLYMAGLKIYSTENIEIQKIIEKEYSKKKYILNSKQNKGSTSQSAMVIIDQSTGYVVGLVGSLGEKETSMGFNRAVQAKRQTGSSIKPIAILAPAIEKKIITASTIYKDEETSFNDGGKETYKPQNYNEYLGDITVRRALETSQNIPFVKIMQDLTPKTSIKYLKKMGVTTLSKKDENLSLALRWFR